MHRITAPASAAQHLVPETPGAEAGRLAEGGTEGRDALETAIARDDLDEGAILNQFSLGLRNPRIGNVTAQGLPDRVLEGPHQMPGTDAAFFGQIDDRQWPRQSGLDTLLKAAQAPARHSWIGGVIGFVRDLKVATQVDDQRQRNGFDHGVGRETGIAHFLGEAGEALTDPRRLDVETGGNDEGIASF